METLVKKLRLIYLPFLAVAIGFLVVYTFLVWLLISEFHSINLKENIVQIWLPIGLSWIPVWIWLRPRFRLLYLKNSKRAYLFGLMLLSIVAIAGPTIITQKYIETAAGKLTELKNIKAIAFNKPTKFYTVESYYLDKRHIGVRSSFEVTGKSKENFEMQVYVAIPMLSRAADTIDTYCTAWLGVKYTKLISNSLTDSEKNKAFGFYIEKTMNDFESANLNNFIYLSRAENNNETDGFKAAILPNNYYKPNDNILLPVNKPFELRNGNKLGWIFGSFGLAAGLLLIILLSVKLNNEEIIRFEKGLPPEEDEDYDIFEFIRPREGFFFTPLIVFLNILIFLIMVFAGLGFISFQGTDLLKWGANFRPSTLTGEWWRLITSVFLHGGVEHLIANMYGLFFVGVLLEPRLGKSKFIFAYLFTGIIASCTSLWWYEATISVGASGAIFGLYGLFLSLLITKTFPPDFRKSFLFSTLVFIGFNLVMGLSAKIDNAAHIGGLLSGALLGLAFSPSFTRPESKVRNITITSVAVIGIAAVSVLLIMNRVDPTNRYTKLMIEFAQTEQKAMSFFNLPNNSADDKYLKVIKDEGIPYWKECRSILNKIDSIENLPAELVAQGEMVKRYCDYRITSFELMAETIEKKKQSHPVILQLYNNKIELIIKKINGEEVPDSLLIFKPVVKYIVDGMPVGDVSSLTPDKVESVTLLRPDEACQIYGESCREGVVVIFTKKWVQDEKAKRQSN